MPRRPNGPVRVGFLGAGFIATFHSKMLRAGGADVERVGVYDLDRARAEAFVAAAGGFVAASVDEVLASCDAAYVCTWTAGRAALIDAACDAGVAVFVEKPLGVDLVAAEAVADRLTRSGVVHQVGLVLHHSPALALVRSELDDFDRVGEVMTVVFRDDQAFPVGGMYGSDWRSDAARAGSGVLLEHSIHDLDLLDRLVGPLTSVSADERNFAGNPGVEDLVVARFGLAGGGVATLTTVWHDVTDRPSLRRLEIICRRAIITVEGDWWGPVTVQTAAGTVSWSGDEVEAECARRGLGTPNPDVAFVEAVASGTPAVPGAAVALRAHQLVEATYRSARAGGESLPL